MWPTHEPWVRIVPPELELTADREKSWGGYPRCVLGLPDQVCVLGVQGSAIRLGHQGQLTRRYPACHPDQGVQGLIIHGSTLFMIQYTTISQVASFNSLPPPPGGLSTSTTTPPPPTESPSSSTTTPQPPPGGPSTSTTTLPPPPGGPSTSTTNPPPPPGDPSTSTTIPPPQPEGLSTSTTTSVTHHHVPGAQELMAGLAMDSNTIILVDNGQGDVLRYRLDRCRVQVLASRLSRPAAISQHGHGEDTRYFVAEWGAGRVQVYGPHWQPLYTISRQGYGNGMLRGPWSMAVTPEDTLLVADAGNHRISEFSLEGNFVDHIMTDLDALPYGLSLHGRYLWLRFFGGTVCRYALYR